MQVLRRETPVDVGGGDEISSSTAHELVRGDRGRPRAAAGAVGALQVLPEVEVSAGESACPGGVERTPSPNASMTRWIH